MNVKYLRPGSTILKELTGEKKTDEPDVQKILLRLLVFTNNLEAFQVTQTKGLPIASQLATKLWK